MLCLRFFSWFLVYFWAQKHRNVSASHCNLHSHMSDNTQQKELTCYVCEWTQIFKLAHSMPPHINNNVNLAQWLHVLFRLIHSPWGCQFNSPSCTTFFFWLLSRLILNTEPDWLVVMFTTTGCHVDITTSQSDSRCAWFGCFSHNAHLLSFIHCVAPIVLSSLSKFSYNLEIIFFSLTFFSLASIFHEYGMIHKKSSAAHNI